MIDAQRSVERAGDLGELSIHQARLDNGLRVVIGRQPRLHGVAITLFVRVGSRHEDDANNGLSHFLEHMLYRGTVKHPSAHAQNHAFERLGGTLYAATATDHTTLSITVPPSSVGPTMALLGELLRGPRLGEIEIEKRIVREEILEDLDERGRQIEPDNVSRAVMFAGSALGYPITGPIDALDRFDEPSMRAHLKRFYVAGNAALSVAGACDVDEVMALARQHLGDLPHGEEIAITPFVGSQRGFRRKHVPSPGSQTDLRISFLTPGERHAMAPAIDLLLRVIDDGMSTRLYHRLCDAGGMVYDCSASWEPFEETGAIDLAAEVQHARLAQVVSECLDLCEELAREGPTDDEIDKARDRHKWAIEAALDDPGEIAAVLGGAVLFDRPKTLRATQERLDRVRAEDVRDAAKAVFRRDGLTLVTVGSLDAQTRSAIRARLAKFGRGARRSGIARAS
ncbi:MAG: M16 family metallopeptidase [Polyangiales bacterium]